MKRYLWALCFSWLVWVGLAASAQAEEIRVCARPPDVKADVGRWSYSGGGQVLTTANAAEFEDKSRGFTVYVFDPSAPPDSVDLLPARYKGLTCTGGKPAASPPPAVSASAAKAAAPKPAPAARPGGAQSGTGKGTKGEKQTTGEKVASELAVAGAIATGQMNEDLKNPAGKKYGIPGGKNPNGPNHPVAQAAAGVTLIALGVLSPGTFAKKLKDAVAKKTPLLLSSTTLTKEGLETLIKDHGPHALADAMRANGTVAPYSVMKKITAGLGGAMQAHHLIEQRFVGKFNLGTVENGLSVILKDAEHKAISKKLATIDIKKIQSPTDLWQAYQTVYVDHPHWLDAIRHHFAKGK